MKIRLLLILALLSSIALNAQPRYVTLTVDSTNRVSELSIGTNETAEVVTFLGTLEIGGGPPLQIIKNGVSREFTPMLFSGHGQAASALRPVVVAGPATLRLGRSDSTSEAQCTIKIEPESFPPGLTIILPEGTVGTIHVESSTNLVQWADEWVHTFANTNENRFFRLRAERTLP